MRTLIKKLRVVNNSDGLINFITIVLATIGLVMAVSASMTAAENSSRILLLATVKQSAYFIISYLAMVFVSKRFNYKFLKRLIMPLSIFMTLMLLATLFYEPVGGAQAWLRFSWPFMTFTLQPSEFAKISLIVLIAMYLGDISPNTKRTSKEILSPVLWMIFIQTFIILVLQHDLGSAVVLLAIVSLILLIPSHPKLRKIQNFGILMAVVGMALIFFLLTDQGLALIAKSSLLKSYQLARFSDYANPFINISGSSFQLAGSLVAFARGSFFGVGLGQSIQKYGYLPETRTDFILALIAEELGFFGVIIVMVLYGLLIYKLIYYAVKVVSEKDKIILTGTAAYIFIHLFFNVGGITATIPLTGVPLLLVSSGGSSTLAVMIAIGMSQNIISKYRKLGSKR